METNKKNASRILVVEPDPVVSMEITHYVHHLGYVVCGLAITRQEAIRKASETQPDLILMDMHLGSSLCGIEAARTIHQRIDIPIVFTMSRADNTVFLQAQRTEPYGFLIKPFTETELGIALETALIRHLSTRQWCEYNQRALDQSEKTFHLLVDSISDYAIYMLDIHGRITSWNPGAERIKGYTASEIIGQHYSVLHPQEGREQHVAHVLTVARKHGRYQEEGWRVRKDGTSFWGIVTLSSIKDERQQCIGFAVITRDLTERKKAEENLAKSERRFRELSEKVRVIPWQSLVETGEFFYVGPQAVTILGYPLEEWFSPSFWSEHMHEDDRRWALDYCREQARILDHYEFEYRMIAKNGEVVWFQDIVQVERDEEGVAKTLQGFLIDITSLKETQDQLAQKKEQALITLRSIGDGVITVDNDQRIECMNPVAEQLTGWREEEAQGKQFKDIFRLIDETTRETLPCPLQECISKKTTVKLGKNNVLITRNGKELAVDDSASPIRMRDGRITGAVMVFHDVTESRRATRDMHYHASHDQLTGLINRREFESRLQHTLEHASAHNSTHALLYIDLDQFKIINDTCGHSAGDDLLKQLSSFMSRQVRERDTLARLGGDEFALLMEHCPLGDAIRVANQFLEAVREFRFHCCDRPFTVGMSIGLVPIDKSTVSIEQVLTQADHACYAAKDGGRNRLHIQRADDEDLARRRQDMGWASRLGHAVQHDQLGLFFQPIRSLHDPALPGSHYEILVRLREESEWITPTVFLKAAERYDLMPLIDRWVVTHALTWLHQDRKRLDELSLCMINLSARTLSDNAFLKQILGLLDDLQFPAEKICFEITETAAISHLDRAITFIKRLKGCGCQFALDDFGTGMSSFSYLKKLPVDFLKIDGSFVEAIVNSAVDYEMVKSINDISHIMGKATIAESVAEEAVFNRLSDIGVDYVQGHWLASPQPLYIPPLAS